MNLKAITLIAGILLIIASLILTVIKKIIEKSKIKEIDCLIIGLSGFLLISIIFIYEFLKINSKIKNIDSKIKDIKDNFVVKLQDVIEKYCDSINEHISLNQNIINNEYHKLREDRLKFNNAMDALKKYIGKS